MDCASLHVWRQYLLGLFTFQFPIVRLLVITCIFMRHEYSYLELRTFHFRSVELIRSDDHIRLLGNGSLLIENVQPDDAGTYSCMARNEWNSPDEIDIEVQVLGKWPAWWMHANCMTNAWPPHDICMFGAWCTAIRINNHFSSSHDRCLNLSLLVNISRLPHLLHESGSLSLYYLHDQRMTNFNSIM